jgi:hypothetical protein
MNPGITAHGVLAGIRRHPLAAAAICVPVIAAGVFTGQSMASATPEPTLAVSSTALHAAPAPHVLYVGNQASGKVVTSSDGTTTPRRTWNIDGCDHDYGAPDQCVPWAVPGSTAQARCAWLRADGFGPLLVAGSNRQDLPETVTDGATYACA